ncbi:MAG: exodeoxyribonuclease III [Candidatus Paceibacterota bacterium]
MKLYSWNVNGIRAWYKKGCFDWFLNEQPDIFALQETKAEIEQLPEELTHPEGYFTYFNSSKTRKGYSGTAFCTKEEPDRVEYGLGVSELDQEGRQITLFFGTFAVINTYFPNGGGGPERLAYKLAYYDAFLTYVNKLVKDGYDVVFCGDINTAHTEIDLARPKENVDNTGFLPVERAWLDAVVGAGFIDTFRLKHSDIKNMYSYWDMKTRARERNVGWRIDYFFVSPTLKESVVSADIHTEVNGSDHCPVSIVLS